MTPFDGNTEAADSGENNDTSRGPAYSVFTKWQKRYIVTLVAFAAWFSTLSSFIYYPVIPQLAESIHTTIEKINLTVTSYMIVSAVAPAIVGDAADMLGRRPLYIVTLFVYLVANIGLAVQSSFPALLSLRMLQSAGISGGSQQLAALGSLAIILRSICVGFPGTFSVAYGVVADLATPAERGTYVGFLSFGITTAPSIGPLFGGVLGARAGWRWIFWFLGIASGACLMLMIMTLPETARGIVGNGSKKPPAIYRLPWSCIVDRSNFSVLTETSERRCHVPSLLPCLRILASTSTALVVTSGAILYMTYCCIQTSLSPLFIKIYGFGQLQVGLIYLPFGIGCTVAALLSGKLIDRDYRITAEAHGLSVDKVHGDDLSKFPIERARLKSVFYPLAINNIAIIGYGWSLHAKAHVSVPLILQFIIGAMIQTCFNINNVLITDINQHAPSTAQASSNIVRCTMSATALALLQIIIDRVGVGWCFTLFGGLCTLCAPLYLVLRDRGMGWRIAKISGTGTGVGAGGSLEADGMGLGLAETQDRVQQGKETDRIVAVENHK